ncbi:MAG: hypothetical protein PHR71_12855 [Polaromonas sp.]|nr:hypothetical protein [Polaromonas sp.]
MLASSGCAWLDARQRELIYRPTPGSPAEFTDLRAGEEHYFVSLPANARQASDPDHQPLTADAGTINNTQRIELWWLPHPDKSAPTLL